MLRPCARVMRELMEMAPELAPGMQAAALRFGSVLLEQAAERVAAATGGEFAAAAAGDGDGDGSDNA